VSAFPTGAHRFETAAGCPPFPHLCDDGVRRSPSIRGGATAAGAALAAFDVLGYSRTRNEVWPTDARGASRLSPYIRHGVLGLRRVWDAVEGGPAKDVRKFRDELLWAEYARHWYTANGRRTRRGIRRELPAALGSTGASGGGSGGWEPEMACVAESLDELHEQGWIVNQQRMWLASHWSVRNGRDWRVGEDHFFRHLLDGSRAANRLGWQWTTGVGSSKPYGFSRRQVEERAPGTCAGCALEAACPIEDWPEDPAYRERSAGGREAAGDSRFGPTEVETSGRAERVWLTAESLGDDPALVANPGLPAVFVFDEPLLGHLRLSSKRLVFLVETLAELGTRRPLELRLGDPTRELAGLRLAVTHAPVPGFEGISSGLEVVEKHPWPWLCRPRGTRVSSFSAWRRTIEEPVAG
jgi:deoxyribodipyrimidine photo-lyase